MKDIEQFKAELVGVSPLIMHNGMLANPRSEAAKALAAVTKGKAKDLDRAMLIEFLGSFYLDAKGEPCVPVDNVLSLIIAGARAYKLGKSAEAGVYDAPDVTTFPLRYKGPRSPQELFNDPTFVYARGAVVSGRRIQRTRPIFRRWKLSIVVEFDPELITREQLALALARGGKANGLGDWRPRYGRFRVEAAA